MTAARQEVVQYLNEAHATELALARVLESQIAMAPRGEFRRALESHHEETRDHADRLRHRLTELGAGGNPVQVALGAAGGVIGQLLALAKTPLDLVRGTGGEEKVLKNAKDACATEALEIATYTALEHLARAVDDDITADLAASIREDEQAMLDRVLELIPALAAAVVDAEVKGDPSFDVTETGAADATREGADRVKGAARQARKVPGVAQAEGAVKGAAAGEEDLAISNYDSLNADEIVSRLNDLSQIDLAKVDVYERKNQSRSTVLDRVESRRGDEPWPSYDEQSVADITKALRAANEDTARRVATYERQHKDRAGVLKATERETMNA